MCGASNVPDPGGRVALAPLGAYLPAAGITLDAREIGGVVSEGMLCSEIELGLAALPSGTTGHDGDPGIMILPKDAGAPPGTPLREALPAVHDFIYELDLTPNRPDALGHIGLARELGALYGLPFSTPEPAAPLRVAEGDVRDAVRVEIEDLERCPHYGASLVTDVAIGPSPAWLPLSAREPRRAIDFRTSSTSRTSCCSSGATRSTRSTSTRCAAAASSRGAPCSARSSRRSTASSASSRPMTS